MQDNQQQEIEALVRLLDQNRLTELEVERNDVRIRIRREPTAQSSPPFVERTVFHPEPTPVEPTASHPDQGKFLTVTSPIVGTFYRSPSPDADAYVEEGDFVKKGQVLCIVEAMKLMNEIEAEADGRVVKVLLESTTPVEYGQPLFLIDPMVAS